MNDHAAIPMKFVGPLKITGSVLDGELEVPLATFETPLWPSVARGARVTRRAGGIAVHVLDERMARSVLVEADDAAGVAGVIESLRGRRAEIEAVAAGTSRFARLVDWHAQVVGNLLYFRVEVSTGDAAGHNMVTKAADAVLGWMLREYPHLRHVSVSGNFCADKKVSAVNGLLGRGRSVVADVRIPAALCESGLKTTAARVAALNVKKNLIGSIVAGGVRTANAHYANMLLAFYLATGQDAANLVEGSQGFTHAEDRGGDLYFSVTLPSVIVGTVGAGKDLPFVQDNLLALGCREPRAPGDNARRLAAIAAATVLCGELSLLAALTNRGELMRSHEKIERGG